MTVGEYFFIGMLVSGLGFSSCYYRYKKRHYKADKEAQKRGYENWIEAYLNLCD